MGRKIIPLFTSEKDENADYERFKDSVEDIDVEKAISICKISKDAKGHSTPLSFRMPDVSLRIIGEIKSREERFKCDSDILRTVHIIGIKVLLDYFKQKKIIGDSLDDCLLTLDKLNERIKTEEMYETLKMTSVKLKTLAHIFKERKPVFNKKVEQMEKEFKTIRDVDWREYLLKEFNKEVKKIRSEVWSEDE